MNTPLKPTEHSPNCLERYIEWQAVIVEGLPRRGRCINCGALEIDRSNRIKRPVSE